jgi:hypothetical protein
MPSQPSIMALLCVTRSKPGCNTPACFQPLSLYMLAAARGVPNNTPGSTDVLQCLPIPKKKQQHPDTQPKQKIHAR